MIQFEDVWVAQRVSFFVWDCEVGVKQINGLVLTSIEINERGYALVMSGLDRFQWFDWVDMEFFTAKKCEKAGKEPGFYNSVRTDPQEAFASILEAAFNRKSRKNPEGVDFDEQW